MFWQNQWEDSEQFGYNDVITHTLHSHQDTVLTVLGQADIKFNVNYILNVLTYR